MIFLWQTPWIEPSSVWCGDNAAHFKGKLYLFYFEEPCPSPWCMNVKCFSMVLIAEQVLKQYAYLFIPGLLLSWCRATCCWEVIRQTLLKALLWRGFHMQCTAKRSLPACLFTHPSDFVLSFKTGVWVGSLHIIFLSQSVSLPFWALQALLPQCSV